MGQPKVFLSHSHQDSIFAKRLVNDLEKAGAEVWYDISGIDSGDFLKRIDDALRNCEWLVLILTPSAIASSYVTTEVNAGLHRVHQERMRAVIPVLAAPCAPDSIPTLWDMQHRFDTVADYATALAGLCRALGLASTPSAPSVVTQSAERPPDQVSRSQAPAPQPAESADDLVTQGKALEAKSRY